MCLPFLNWCRGCSTVCLDLLFSFFQQPSVFTLSASRPYQVVLSKYSQGVNIQSSRVQSLNAITLPGIMKTISKLCLKALWQVFWSIWMPAALTVWPKKSFRNLKFLSMLIIGQYPAGFLTLVHLPEIDSPLVALKLKSNHANHSSFAPGVMPKST